MIFYKTWLKLSLIIVGSLILSTHTIAQEEEQEDMNHYEITLTAEPQTPAAQEAFNLSLQVLNHGAPVRDFDTVHEKLMHLIVVSEDLSEFLHLHPEYHGEGLFTLDGALLPKDANYVLFADFTPTGDTQRVVRLELPTINATEAQAELTAGTLETTAGPLAFHLEVPQPLSAGEHLTLTFHVMDAASGEPVNTLEEYLGAAGHLVIIDQSAEIYLHTHPDHDEAEGEHAGHAGHTETPAYGPEIQFMTEFPTTGAYALWLQVQYQGEIYTAPFVIEVTEQAESTPEATEDPHASHHNH